MQLGKNILELRKAKGLSQEKLAEQVNVTRQTISNWELGETAPNPEQLLLLSKVLEKSVDELLGNESSITKRNNEAEDTDAFKKIRNGLVVILGAIAGVCSYATNRFRYDEILLFVGIGALVGYCLSMVLISALKYLRKK